jgi:hypothetical protein
MRTGKTFQPSGIVTVVMREIAAQTVVEEARREARRAVERLNGINRDYRDPLSRREQSPIVEPSSFEGALAVLYTRFVARWSVVKP